MKKLLFMLLVSPILINAQATLAWQQYTGGVAIATDATDNVYTVSWEYASGGDITLVKRDSNGNFLWETTYDNTDMTRHEVATWVATDNAGNVIVTGTIRSGYASPVDAASLIMKFSPSGTLLWRVVYETSFDGSSTKKCLIDDANNIYVLGMGSGPAGFVTKVKKFNPDGTALWSYFNAAGIGAAQNFKFTPDGYILISGRGIIGSVNGYAKIDTDGNEVWSYAGVNSLTIGDAAGDASGNTYIINGEYVVGTAGSVITKLSSAGTVMWSHTNDIAATKVEVGTDQNPVIGGFPNSGSFGVAFMKYNTTGTVLWTNPDADGAGFNLMLHGVMKLDPANNAYLTAGTLFEMAVCRVNADGTSGYVAHCSGGGYVSGIDFGEDYGSFYIVGGISTVRFNQEPPVEVCDPPVGLFTSGINTTKARANWTVEPGAFQYEVWYKRTTAVNWKKKFVPGINNKLNLKNLMCNTSYVWKIRTVCDTVGVDLKSDFSADQFFTTLVCREGDVIAEEPTMLVYPNPASNALTIDLPFVSEWNISIMNLAGVHVADFTTFEEAVDADIEQIPSGIYIIEAWSGSTRITEKLVISK